jgi:hypothetical protein
LALVAAGAVGVKLRSERSPELAPGDTADCIAPDCIGGGTGGGASRMFPEPLQ